MLNRSFVAVHVTNVRRALALLFRDIAEVVHIDQAIFPPTLSIHGGNSPPLSHWIDPPMRTGFVVLTLIFRHLESFGYPIATSYLGKTCDLIARTCLPETQTAASIATVINQQANYRSITLSQSEGRTDDVGQYCVCMRSL